MSKVDLRQHLKQALVANANANANANEHESATATATATAPAIAPTAVPPLEGGTVIAPELRASPGSSTAARSRELLAAQRGGGGRAHPARPHGTLRAQRPRRRS